MPPQPKLNINDNNEQISYDWMESILQYIWMPQICPTRMDQKNILIYLDAQQLTEQPSEFIFMEEKP